MKKVLFLLAFAMIGVWASAQVATTVSGTDVPLTEELQVVLDQDINDNPDPDVDYKSDDVPIPPPLFIYPNPTANKVTVETENQVVRIDVRNMQGTKVLTVFNEKSAELQSLPAGTYIFTVTMADGTTYTYTVVRR